MDLAIIIDRLKNRLTGFKMIGGAADLDAIGSGVVPKPSCYVVPASESAEDIDLVGGVFEQRITVGFSVILASANQRDATGHAALHGLDPLRRQIKSALNGWTPQHETGEPVCFTSGALLRFDDGLLWWGDDYRVVTYERTV